MARPVYAYELSDSDFSWLISNFQENNPSYFMIENSCLPVSFIKGAEVKAEVAAFPVPVAAEEEKATPSPEK
jgi:hypothetical protein